jgi:hypothetical protein
MQRLNRGSSYDRSSADAYIGLLQEDSMKTNKAYYNVHVTRDGIIVFAFERRKPMKRRGRSAPKIDQDGVCEQFLDDPNETARYSDWGKGTRMTAIATHLNVRRLLRDFVESRLLALDQRIGMIQSQLERIEAMLSQLTRHSDRA